MPTYFCGRSPGIYLLFSSLYLATISSSLDDSWKSKSGSKTDPLFIVQRRPFLGITGNFRSEYEYDYGYEFSVVSTRIGFRGRHFSKCACSERKTRTRSRTRTPI